MPHSNQTTVRLAGLLACTLGLAACESSQRLGSLVPGSRPSPIATPAAPPPLVAAPTTDVDTDTLPPPPVAGSGGLATTPPVANAPLSPAPGLSTPTPPAQPSAPAPSGVATAPGNLPRNPPPPVSAPAAPAAAPTRTGVTGNWSLTESAGTRCRLTLSSAPKLDLYGAGTNGCAAKELQRVNAWELSGSEVILYEPGGAVVARLRQSPAGGYSGVSTRSGAPISMAK